MGAIAQCVGGLGCIEDRRLRKRSATAQTAESRRAEDHGAPVVPDPGDVTSERAAVVDRPERRRHGQRTIASGSPARYAVSAS